MAVDTKERLLKASTELFQRQGLAGTGIKQILAAAHAPFSSLYHHYPGGKDELAAEVVLTSGAGYQRLVELVWDAAPDAVESVRSVFEGAAAVLEETDYVEGCPIATVALEVASTNETLRLATAEVFEAWTLAATSRLIAAGCDPARARRTALVIIALLEGAFVLCQATRSVEPMRSAGEAAAAVVELELNQKRPR
jgi:AcrR family transcriptional regulator